MELNFHELSGVQTGDYEADVKFNLYYYIVQANDITHLIGLPRDEFNLAHLFTDSLFFLIVLFPNRPFSIIV